MKIILNILFAIIITPICFGQTYDSEIPVNIKIRNDAGDILESKNVSAVFHFKSSNKDLKNCSGIQFSPYGNTKLEQIVGFVFFVETDNWRYITEMKIPNGNGYYNKCSFAYSDKYSNSLIKGTKEIILIKYQNGTNTILIIGYDGINTLVITI